MRTKTKKYLSMIRRVTCKYPSTASIPYSGSFVVNGDTITESLIRIITRDTAQITAYLTTVLFLTVRTNGRGRDGWNPPHTLIHLFLHEIPLQTTLIALWIEIQQCRGLAWMNNRPLGPLVTSLLCDLKYLFTDR